MSLDSPNIAKISKKNIQQSYNNSIHFYIHFEIPLCCQIIHYELISNIELFSSLFLTSFHCNWMLNNAQHIETASSHIRFMCRCICKCVEYKRKIVKNQFT